MPEFKPTSKPLRRYNPVTKQYVDQDLPPSTPLGPPPGWTPQTEADAAKIQDCRRAIAARRFQIAAQYIRELGNHPECVGLEQALAVAQAAASAIVEQPATVASDPHASAAPRTTVDLDPHTL